jgi:hypothetical protein
MKKAKTMSQRAIKEEENRNKKKVAKEADVLSHKKVKIFNDLLDPSVVVPLKKSKSIQPAIGLRKEGSINLGVPSKKLDIVAEEIEEEEKLSPEELAKIKKSLGSMNHTRLTEKEDRIAKSTWWEWLNYTWAHDLLRRGQEGKSIKLEHLGGIK